MNGVAHGGNAYREGDKTLYSRGSYRAGNWAKGFVYAQLGFRCEWCISEWVVWR